MDRAREKERKEGLGRAVGSDDISPLASVFYKPEREKKKKKKGEGRPCGPAMWLAFEI